MSNIYKFYGMTLFVILLLSFKSFAYNVNTGDVLHLEVYGEPELSLDVIVDALGFIEYPFVGKVRVLDDTVETIKSKVVEKLKDGYFVNPQLTVIVKAFRPFFIQGEVKSPGSYDFEVGLTVSRAIALAGGFTERASKKKIYLTRSGDPTKQEIKVSMDQKLKAGDVLLIKESFF